MARLNAGTTIGGINLMDVLKTCQVVDAGLDEDGNWVRWNIGLQVCWNHFGTVSDLVTNSSTYDGITTYRCDIPVVFPVEFSENPAVVPTGNPQNHTDMDTNITTVSTTGTNLRIHSQTDFEEVLALGYIAVGWWKEPGDEVAPPINGGSGGGMEIHGNEWHDMPFATSAALNNLISTLHNVATSGSYSDLKDTPTASSDVEADALVKRNSDGYIFVKRLQDEVISEDTLESMVETFVGDSSAQDDFGDWVSTTPGVRDLPPLLGWSYGRLPVDTATFILCFILVLYLSSRDKSPKSVRLWASDEITEITGDYLLFDTVIFDNGNFYDEQSSYPEAIKISGDGLYLIQATVDLETVDADTYGLVLECTDLDNAYELDVDIRNVGDNGEIALRVSTVAPLSDSFYVGLGLFNINDSEFAILSAPYSTPSLSITRLGDAPDVPAEMLGAPVVKSARGNRRDGPMLSEIILNKQKHMR